MFNPENIGKAALTAKPLLNITQKNYSISQGFNRGNLLNAMANSGAYPADGLPSDSPGQVCRYRINGDKPGSKNGWISYFIDGLGAAFGNWKTGIQATYFANNGQYSIDDFKRIRQETKATYIKAQKAQYMEAAKQSKELWKRVTPAHPGHAYLMKKKISPYGLRQYKNSLIVPVMNNDGEIISLQFICPEGSKRFKSGGQLKGGRFIIGDPDSSQFLLFAEGYATAATLYQATSFAVVVCFNAGNIMTVASDMRQTYRRHKLILCADNDQYTEGNPGLSKAQEAAALCRGIVITPTGLTQGTDFNDMAMESGLASVTALVMGVAK